MDDTLRFPDWDISPFDYFADRSLYTPKFAFTPGTRHSYPRFRTWIPIGYADRVS